MPVPLQRLQRFISLQSKFRHDTCSDCVNDTNNTDSTLRKNKNVKTDELLANKFSNVCILDKLKVNLSPETLFHTHSLDDPIH